MSWQHFLKIKKNIYTSTQGFASSDLINKVSFCFSLFMKKNYFILISTFQEKCLPVLNTKYLLYCTLLCDY